MISFKNINPGTPIANDKNKK